MQETVIDPINEEVHRILDQLTLKKLTEHAEQTNQAAQSMYYIWKTAELRAPSYFDA